MSSSTRGETEVWKSSSRPECRNLTYVVALRRIGEIAAAEFPLYARNVCTKCSPLVTSFLVRICAPFDGEPEVALRPPRKFFFNRTTFRHDRNLPDLFSAVKQADRVFPVRNIYVDGQALGGDDGEIDGWERRARLFVRLPGSVRASVHGEADRLSACLRIFLSRARSCPRVGAACAATVIARMPYDTGEIGSFGTNRPYEPLSRCICKAVSNCARASVRERTPHALSIRC